jgi:hypothetical protein
MEALSFDGMTFNTPESPYLLLFDAESRSGFTLETQYRDRLNQTPIREGASQGATERPFIVTRNPQYTGTPKTAAELRLEMFAHFSVDDGERILTARVDRFDDESPEVFLLADVVALQYWDTTAEDDYISGVWRATDGVWRAVASSSAVTDVPGSTYARPEVTISGGVECERKTYGISEPSTRGVAGHPVKLPIALEADSWVFDRGRSVPFHLDGWLRLDIPARKRIEVDVFTGTGITNPLAGALTLGGLAPESTNDEWTLDDWEVSAHLSGDGALRPQKLGQTFNSVAYGILSEFDSLLNLRVEGGDVLPRDYDGVAIATGRKVDTVEFGVPPILSSGMDCRAFATKLPAGASRYQVSGSLSHANSNQEVVVGGSLDIGDMSGAVAIGFGIEPIRSIEHFHTETDEDGNTTQVGDGYPRAIGSLSFSGSITITFQEAITIELLSTVVAYAYNAGYVKNLTTGDTIRLRRAFAVGDIIIDAYAKTVVAEGGRAYLDIRMSNQHHWMRLRAVIDNEIALEGCTVAWSYQARYVML